MIIKTTRGIQQTPPLKGLFGINNVTPIKIASCERMDKSFGGGDVGSNRNIVNVTQPEKRCFVGLVRLRSQRISEKKKHVDFVACNSGCNLLGAALNTAQEACDIKACCFCNHFLMAR